MDNLGDGLPVRSHEGQAALDIFYFEFNEVNFYVEDEDQENLYELLFSRIFPQIQISRVFPLGGKLSVLSHARDFNNQVIGRKSVYVVDGDFDEMFEKQKCPENVFYLDRYCIENFFADEHGIIELVVETHPKKKRSEIKNKLLLPDAIKQSLSSLAPLFRLFYCVQKLDLGIKNCDTKPEEYCLSSKLWVLDQNKLTNYQNKVQTKIEEHEKGGEFSELYHVCEAIICDDNQLHKLVSGKFLLAQIFHYVKSKYPLGSITFDSFIFRLAKNVSLNSFKNFSEAVNSYLLTPQQNPCA